MCLSKRTNSKKDDVQMKRVISMQQDIWPYRSKPHKNEMIFDHFLLSMFKTITIICTCIFYFYFFLILTTMAELIQTILNISMPSLLFVNRKNIHINHIQMLIKYVQMQINQCPNSQPTIRSNYNMIERTSICHVHNSHATCSTSYIHIQIQAITMFTCKRTQH